MVDVCLVVAVSVAAGTSCWPEKVAAQAMPTPEYQVKAAFLYQFTQFVEWPASAFPSGQAPLVIGVLGDDPFGAYLDEIVSGEVANGHPIVVQRYRQAEEVAPCHILFVSRSEEHRLEEIFSHVGGRPLLTVGDADDFARAGGMIQFVTDEGRIRLRVNADAARLANLTISSRLLSLAEIVTASRI
jgi:hypothetical protein